MNFSCFPVLLFLLCLNPLLLLAQSEFYVEQNAFEQINRKETAIQKIRGEGGVLNYVFNGIDSEILLDGLANTRQLTFCAWIKPNDLLKKNMAIVGIPDLFWFRTTNTRELQFTQPGIADNNTDRLLLTNQNWYFVSLVVDYPKAKIYLNGQLVKEFKWKGEAYPWSGQLLIGKDNWQEHFDGIMKEISVYSNALNSAKLSEMYNTSKDFVQLTDGLVFYHPMDKQKAYFSEKDSKPESNIVFIKDTVRSIVADYNGMDHFMSFGELPIDNATTISLWIKPKVFNRDFGALVGVGHAYSLRINSAGYLLFTIPQEIDIVSLNSKLKLNEWQHIAITYKEQENLKFYINGVETQTFNVKPFKQTSKEIDIGINLWNDHYWGQMDDVIIWNRVLNENEIKDVSKRKQEEWNEQLSQPNYKWIYILTSVILLIGLMAYYKRKSTKEIHAGHWAENEQFKTQIRDVVLNNLSDSSFSVTGFAEAMNMSKTKLYNTLKDEVGQAPKEYIRDIRLDEAARLLKTTKLHINEVAMETGFESRAYFNKCFKSKFDFTPTDYRKI